MAEPKKKLTAEERDREADRSTWLFILCVGFWLMGFLFQTDLGYDDAPIQTSYSVSLGATCEQQIRTCRMRANPPEGFRTELTRNEVVELPGDKDVPLRLYTGCTIWSMADWSCEGGRIGMTNGVIRHNELQPDPDIYYLPRIGWKMAKLHILPLDSVRHAKDEPPAHKNAA